MNLDQTFSILFWLNKAKTNSKGLTAIWIRITIDGKRAEFSTARKIFVDHWDAALGRANEACPDAKTINDYLSSVHNEITRRYNILLTTKDYVSAEDVKHSFRGEKEVKKTFFDVFNEFIKFHKKRVEKKELSEGRFKRFAITQGKCASFIRQNYKRHDILLNDIKSPFIVQFQHHLLTVDNIGHNTSMKHAKDLKQVMTFAVTMGYIPANPFQSFKCTIKKVKRVFLDDRELELLMNLKLPITRLEEVRDCFIFCCFTGYAFSDVWMLTPDNVTIGKGNF